MRINIQKVELLAAKKDWTWSELARRARMSRQNLSTVKVRGTATARTICKIAAALGVEPEELLFEEVKENG